MRSGRRYTGSAGLALGACFVLLLGCSKDEPITAPEPVDETAAVKAAWVASGFASPELYTAGTVTLSAPGPPGDMRAHEFRHVEQRRDTVWSCEFSEPDANGKPLRAEGSMCFYIKQDFLLAVIDEYGDRVEVRKPFPNEDLDREFIFRRERADLPWHLDSLGVSFMQSDDKMFCDICHTKLLSLRVVTPGLDSSLATGPNELRRAGAMPRIPPGAPLQIETTTEQLGDFVFVRNGGEWSRLPATGPRSFAGTVLARPGFNVLSVQVMTDSSLVAVGQHYSEYTLSMEYVGGGYAPP